MNKISTKAKYLMASVIGLVSSGATYVVSRAAYALDGMTSTSTPQDFTAAARTDFLGMFLQILGSVFVVGLIIAVIWFAYGRFHRMARGKH